MHDERLTVFVRQPEDRAAQVEQLAVAVAGERNVFALHDVVYVHGHEALAFVEPRMLAANDREQPMAHGRCILELQARTPCA